MISWRLFSEIKNDTKLPVLSLNFRQNIDFLLKFRRLVGHVYIIHTQNLGIILLRHSQKFLL